MSRPRTAGVKPPSKWLLLAEGRAAGEFALSVAALPLLATAPRGDGHTVLVLPGFLTSDISTEFLRGYLRGLGYDAVGWELGRNLGGLYRMREGLRGKLRQAARHGRRVSVIGWSLGGVYARDLALAHPELIRGIITLGSPFSRDLRANNVGTLYDRVSGETPEQAPGIDLAALTGPMPVPTTSIWSRTDGVVAWQTSVVQPKPDAENIEVLGASHFGLGANPAVLWAIADRLAQPEGAWRAFGRGGPLGVAYGRAAVPAAA